MCLTRECLARSPSKQVATHCDACKLEGMVDVKLQSCHNCKVKPKLFNWKGKHSSIVASEGSIGDP